MYAIVAYVSVVMAMQQIAPSIVACVVMWQ